MECAICHKPLVVRLDISGPVRKCLVEVDQSESIADLIIVDFLHALFATRFTDREGFNDGMNLHVGGEFQHIEHLRSTPDMRRTNVAAVPSEILGLELRQRSIGKTDVVEVAADFQGREVVAHVEFLGAVCAV